MRLKTVFLIFIFMSASFVSAKTRQLFNSYEECCQIELELKELEFLRRDSLNDFLTEHMGASYVQNNQKYIINAAVKSNSETLIDNILEQKYTDKKARKNLLKKLILPELNKYRLNQLNTSLENLVERLRQPDASGRKYANYSRDSQNSVYKKKLVAKHAIGTWQVYESVFNDRIFKIRMYSPSKLDLFNMNRDVFLDCLEIKYKLNNENKTVKEVYNRLLKRGESTEFHLPEIAESVHIKLTYATKPEHRNKAVFYVEPVAATLVDLPDSPFLPLINSIQQQRFAKGGTKDKQNGIKALKSQIRMALEQVTETDHSSMIPDAKIKTPGKSADNSYDYAIQYFHYMLKDKNVTRDQLIEKFSELFSVSP
jgi:hypothetical protein